MSVMPVYRHVILPGAHVYLRTSDVESMTDRKPAAGERVTFVLLKEETTRENMTSESFYPIGASGTVTEVNPAGYLSIVVENRVHIDEITVLPNRTVSLSMSRRPEREDLRGEEAAARLEQVKKHIIDFAEPYQWGQMVRVQAQRWENLWDVACAISPWMAASAAERYALLEEDSLQTRFDMTEKLVLENLELMRIHTEAESAQEEDYQKLYRESAIKKQMEYLQKELDGMHPEEVSDVRRLELLLESSGMNETAQREGRRVLTRLKNEGGQGPEAGMLTDYLELLTSLPWKKEPAQPISLREVREVLDHDHSGLEKVKKRIIQQLAVMTLRAQQSGSILCFVGAPGTGKTSIGQSIANALGRRYVRVSLGGIRDEADQKCRLI